MTNRRIYLVEDKKGEKTLVEAASQSQALRYVVSDKFDCRVASTIEVATIISSGGILHNGSNAEVKEAEPTPEEKPEPKKSLAEKIKPVPEVEEIPDPEPEAEDDLLPETEEDVEEAEPEDEFHDGGF